MNSCSAGSMRGSCALESVGWDAVVVGSRSESIPEQQPWFGVDVAEPGRSRACHVDDAPLHNSESTAPSLRRSRMVEVIDFLVRQSAELVPGGGVFRIPCRLMLEC